MMLYRIICLVIGYFCGCISSGYFVGKLYHMDIRTKGSGNAGTTNVLRTLGKLPALITFVGDLAKAIVPIVIIRCLFQGEEAYLLCLYLGLGVVLGHNFPFYLRFKGGKGIAVTAAVVLSAANPIMIPIGLAIFIIAVAITRYVSVIIICSLVYPGEYIGISLAGWKESVVFTYDDLKFIIYRVGLCAAQTEYCQAVPWYGE